MNTILIFLFAKQITQPLTSANEEIGHRSNVKMPLQKKKSAIEKLRSIFFKPTSSGIVELTGRTARKTKSAPYDHDVPDDESTDLDVVETSLTRLEINFDEEKAKLELLYIFI